MIKAMRIAGGAPTLVIGVAAAALTVAPPGHGDTHPAAIATASDAGRTTGSVGGFSDAGATLRRPVRLEDVQRDERRQDERRLRKREWHRHWDNRLDFWDPSRGRKVFVG